MSLGKTIAKLRVRKGLTQAQLAEKIEMAAAHINRLEHDRMKPRPKTLERIAEALSVSKEDLMLAAGHETPPELAAHDPELASLLSQIPLLDSEQKQALRTFLRSMITCQQIQRLTSARAS